MIAWHEGYREVIIEVDAQVVLTLVYATSIEFHPLGAIISDIISLANERKELELRTTSSSSSHRHNSY